MKVIIEDGEKKLIIDEEDAKDFYLRMSDGRLTLSIKYDERPEWEEEVEEWRSTPKTSSTD